MNNLFEYNDYQHHIKMYTTISGDELMEMANISPKITGLENVYLWIGPNPFSHGKRIKVSNLSKKFCEDNCFTLTIPDYDIIGKVNKKLITKNVIQNIILFVEKNKDLIDAYSEKKLTTDELIFGLVSIAD